MYAFDNFDKFDYGFDPIEFLGKDTRLLHRTSNEALELLRANISGIVEFLDRFESFGKSLNSDLTGNSKKGETFSKFMGESCYDSLCLCRENEFGLMSDEYAIRAMTYHEFEKMPTSSVRDLLAYLLTKPLVVEERSKILEGAKRLIELGY